MSQPAPKSDLPELAQFMCFAVYSTNHAFGRIYKPLLDELGLTYPQYLVMVALWERDGQTVGSIGQTLFLESNTLTPLLKRLEKAGYVARRRSSHDERQVFVHLTDKGQALREHAKCVPQRLGKALGLTVDDIASLREDLLKLRNQLLNAASQGA